jgi:hypothetical protein
MDIPEGEIRLFVTLVERVSKGISPKVAHVSNQRVRRTAGHGRGPSCGDLPLAWPKEFEALMSGTCGQRGVVKLTLRVLPRSVRGNAKDQQGGCGGENGVQGGDPSPRLARPSTINDSSV